MGGKHAIGKVEKLLLYGPKLHVIAPEVSEKIASYDDLMISYREFVDEDLNPRPDFVIIACDDMNERKRIAKLCREQHILVNSVDDVENCDFIFPSVISRGKLSVGIMTSGASPVFGMDLKKQIEEWLPDNIESILEWLEMIRPEMKEKYRMKKKEQKYSVRYMRAW